MTFASQDTKLSGNIIRIAKIPLNFEGKVKDYHDRRNISF